MNGQRGISWREALARERKLQDVVRERDNLAALLRAERDNLAALLREVDPTTSTPEHFTVRGKR